MKHYIYKDKEYPSLYHIRQLLPNYGIPSTVTDEQLQEIGIVVAVVEPNIEELKKYKLQSLKFERDKLEVEPIEYNSNFYDYDEKARDRINSAIIALDLQGEKATIEWTLANNTNTTVTANDLRMVIASVAIRSNKLHIAYREAKEKINGCSTREELDKIILE